jgi:hypothetical protein
MNALRGPSFLAPLVTKDQSNASEAIGRNQTYVQQYLKRGHPVELGERDRRKLAQILGISPDDLRGPDNPLPRINGADAQPLLPPESGATDVEELRDRCRVYELAFRKIVPSSRTAPPPRSPGPPCASSNNWPISRRQRASFDSNVSTGRPKRPAFALAGRPSASRAPTCSV